MPGDKGLSVKSIMQCARKKCVPLPKIPILNMGTSSVYKIQLSTAGKSG